MTVVAITILATLVLGDAAFAASTRYVFWNTRSATDCTSPGTCVKNIHNHLTTPDLFTDVMGTSPALIGLGVVEFCEVDFDNFVAFYGPHTGKDMASLPYTENPNAGACACKVPNDPNHSNNQWFGNANFSIGSLNSYALTVYTHQAAGEDPRGYACLDMTVAFVRMYSCTTHLAAASDTVAAQQLGEVRSQLYAHSSATGPLPELSMDANLHPSQSTIFDDLYYGVSGESSMTDVNGFPPCGGSISWDDTCLHATIITPEKIDYVWIPDSYSVTFGSIDSGPWFPNGPYDSDHSILYGQF